MSGNPDTHAALMDNAAPRAYVAGVMGMLLANVVLLLPLLIILGAAVALLPPWFATLLWMPVVTAALIGVPVYLIGGAVHAFCTAGRDHRRAMADAEAHHRAILAKHAALGGTPAPPRRYRLGEGERG